MNDLEEPAVRDVPPAEPVAPVDGPGTPIGRRLVLGMLGLGAAGVLFGSGLQDRLARALSPGLASLLPSGGRFRIYSVVGFPAAQTEATWRFAVSGMVDRPFDLGFAELTAMEPTAITADFHCVTGWRVPDVAWVGVRLADLLDRAGVQSGATALVISSFDDVYTESLTLDQARRDDVIVAYRMEGKPVSHAHGGPVRLYAAPMYGYKSLKWLSGIEVVDRVVPGYWERRGYDVDAWVGRSNGRDDAPTS